MLSNYYEDTGVMLDYIQNATLYNCKLDYCFLENLFINNSPIGLNAPNEARFTNVTLNNLLVTSGNIGIGVANPGYELDVNGDINFTGNLFKNGVPLYTGGGGTGGNGSTSVFLTRSAQSIGTQTITTGLNILKFPDNELSSGQIVYNSTTGAFYVTLEGLYSIFVDVDFYNADKAVDLYILKNGSETSGEGRIAWVNCPANDATTINANLYLEAGDYITVNIYNYSASSFTTPYANNKVNSFAMALFNSSQWQGDIGNPISYTVASVTMLDTIITNLTVNNVLVTVGSIGIGGVADPDYKLDVFGDINLTGDIYKNDVLYLPSPVYLTRSAQTQDYQTILPGVNVLKFPDAGHSTGDITYNGTTGRFTVNQDGLYSVFVDVDFYNADKSVDVYILKNNIEDSINGRIAWINCPANDATSLNAMVYLEETDYITVIVRNSSSNNFTTPYDNNKVNSFAMSLMNSSSSPRASQWIGDIGSTISYTSGTVLATNVSITNLTCTNSVLSNITASNILIANATVTGTILILGNSLKAVSNANTVGNLFTTGGNVGIGTTAPNFNLTVNGTIGANAITTGALAATNISVTNLLATNETITNLLVADDIRVTDLSSGATTLTSVTAGGITVTAGGLIATFNSNTLGNIFTTGGNVGIGTTAPSFRLDVNGTFEANNTSGVLCFASTGNVGIGTTAPSQIFQVGDAARLRISNDVTDYTLIGTKTTDDSNNTRIVISGQQRGGNAGHIEYVATTRGSHIFYNQGGSVTAMTIVSSGNVGIGTVSPSARLQINVPVDNIYSDIDSGAARIFGTAFTSGHSGTMVINSTNSYARNVGASLALGGRLFNFGSGYQHATFAKLSGVQANNVDSYNGNFVIEVLFGTGLLVERLRINQDGNVGIGTASPSYQLQLSNDSAGKPNGGSWANSSDEQLKENITTANLDICYNIIKTLPLKRYRWKDNSYTDEQIKDRNVIGWIAQDVQEIFPKAVEESVFTNVDGTTIGNCLTLNETMIIRTLYGAVQKLMSDKENLEDELQNLKIFLQTKYPGEI